MTIDSAWMKAWARAINEDAACRDLGRRMTVSFTMAVDEKRYTVDVRNGEIIALKEDASPLDDSRFVLAATGEVWANLMSPTPPAMDHAFLAAASVGRMQVLGEFRDFWRAVGVLSEWTRVGRALNGGVQRTEDPVWVDDEAMPVGRYVTVELDGVKNRVFYFEAGEGQPVLLQHSAGNENRQWHYVMEDAELKKNYRFIAYDLPAHGKSYPGFGADFFAEEPRITSDWITRFVVALSEALNLDKPIFMGCSIGGVVALHLAERFPEKFKGLIGLCGAIPTMGFFYDDVWLDPSVNPDVTVLAIDGLMAPNTSAWDRQLCRLMQNAHVRSIYAGEFLWEQDNLDPERVGRIDASKVPLYLAAGEFDFTCPPEATAATAKALGIEENYQMIAGAGHFPMADNYHLFRPFLVRALEGIERATS